MKEAKQQAIEKAYLQIMSSDDYNKIKTCIDEDGWNQEPTIYDVDYNVYQTQLVGHGIHITRPKSLLGIENNNGWVKITDGFPNKPMECWVYNNSGNIFYSYFDTKPNRFMMDEKMAHVEVTHYYPIEKPKRPIY